MAEIVLTFYACEADGEMIADTLREAAKRPVHLRGETVFGLDFSDASTAERVTGQLDRCAVDLIVAQEAAQALVAQIGAMKRVAPVRWHMVPVLAGGRLA